MDIQNKRLMVIGGAGFIGSHVVDQLLAEEVAEVVVFGGQRSAAVNLVSAARDKRLKRVEGSITDAPMLRGVLEGIDGVFLLSSLWLAECAEDPHAALDINVNGAFAVMEACHDAKVSRIIYSSSATVYGDPVTTLMTEDHPLNNRSMYGATKIAAEQFFRVFYAMYGLEYISLRYTNVYGPRQTSKGKSASVLIRVLDRIADGQAPIIFGDGTQSFDFIYVEDVARANVLGMKSAISDEAFNIGSGRATSLNELVAALLDATGSDLKPEYQPQPERQAEHRVVSVEKAEKLLGFRAQTALVDGVRELVRWRETIHN